jgi:hypothetical protein
MTEEEAKKFVQDTMTKNLSKFVGESVLSDTMLELSLNVIRTALKDSPDYYRSWQANIAMSFKDEYAQKGYRTNGNGIKIYALSEEFVHEIANSAADNFLKLFIK